MKDEEIAAAFPPAVNTETDNMREALSKIAAAFYVIAKHDKELGPKFAAVVKWRMADAVRVEELRKACLRAASDLQIASEAVWDAAIALDMVLLDRAVAKKLDEQHRAH